MANLGSEEHRLLSELSIRP